LFANNAGTISHLTVSGQVTGLGNGACGMVVATNTGTLNQCEAQGTVSGDIAGGLVGIQQSGAVLNSINKAVVNGTSMAGGLTGYLLSGSVNSNYSVSSVASAAGQVGMLVGKCSDATQVSNCYYLAGSNYGLGGTSVDAAGFVSITADSFATGKIARLLNGGNGTSEKAAGVWGQKIGTDAYPVWNGDTVYGVVADAKEYIGNKGTVVALPAITPGFDGVNMRDGYYRDKAGLNKYQTSYTIAAFDDTLTSICKISDTLINNKKFYKISNVLELQWLSSFVNESDANNYTNAILTADIDMAGQTFEPIGHNDGEHNRTYKGIFYGNHHTISNLSISGNYSYRGFFGHIASDTVRDLTLLNPVISGYAQVAGVAGVMEGSVILNCHVVNGTISGTDEQVGGICGKASSGTNKILYCTASGSVASAINTAGGICAIIENSGSVIDGCTNLMTVSSTKIRGGIAGSAKNMTVSNCFNSGWIVSGDAPSAGGIIGYAENMVMNRCVNVGHVLGKNNVLNVGAVYGYSQNLTATNCCYDKQFCLMRKSPLADSLPTADMVGSKLQSRLGDEEWLYAEGRYPRIKYTDTTCNSRMATIAVQLWRSSVSDTLFDNISNVENNFRISVNDNVKWSCSSDVVTFKGDSVLLACNQKNVPILIVATRGNQQHKFSLLVNTGAAPTVTIDTAGAGACEGRTLLLPKADIVYNSTRDTSRTWLYSFDGTNYAAFNPDTFVTRNLGGRTLSVKLRVNNGCGAAVSEGKYEISGQYLNIPQIKLAAIDSVYVGDTVVLLSQKLKAEGWQWRDTAAASTWAALDVRKPLACDFNGDSIRYYASNLCGTAFSNAQSVAVYKEPTLPEVEPVAICEGQIFSLPEVAALPNTCGGKVTASGWQLSSDNFVSHIDTITNADTAKVVANGALLRAFATSSHGTGYSNQVKLTVNPVYRQDTAAVSCDSFFWYGSKLTKTGVYVDTFATKAGCDSIVTLHLTINYPKTSEFSATACSQYQWNDSTYTTSGDYVQHFQTTEGCDSTVTLHLTINYPKTSEFSATACSQYQWNDSTYTTSGDYVQHFQTTEGCDSTVTLHLTINYPKTSEFSATACSQYQWNDSTYTKSGDYMQLFKTTEGCDSTVTLHLTINYPKTSEFSATACSQYQWNDSTYTKSGDYMQLFKTTEGCDSTVTLHLTINYPKTSEFSATACSQYQWNDSTYTTSDDYIQHFQTTEGCDSTVTLHLTINYPKTSEFSATACSQYQWNDSTYTTSDDYIQHFQTTEGCDSTVTLHLTINYPKTSEFSATACSQYQWNDSTYTTSGDYMQHFQTTEGCDSTVTLHLTINYPKTSEFSATACSQYQWNDSTYTTSGDYMQLFKTTEGCDSTVTLHLTINYPKTSEFSATACSQYQWNDSTYTKSGDYMQHFLTTEGCDSTVTLHLTINYPKTSEFSATACSQYQWNDSTYTTSGDYMQLFKTTEGCDSTVTLHLTINYPKTSEFSATACSQYQWNDSTYTKSGDYMQLFKTTEGCDSTVTLHLTINYPKTSEFSATACSQYQWNDSTYTTSGDYMQLFKTTEGCDSTVTLHLTINYPKTSEFSATACSQYQWNDSTYTTSGDYMQSFKTTEDCDSTVTLHLAINYPKTSEFSATACSQYQWNNSTYTTGGDYMQLFKTTEGCDSTVTLHLTINYPKTSEFSATACSQYQWNDSTYTTSGDYMQLFKTTEGCDSTVTLHLTVGEPVSKEIRDTVKANYVWNDSTYTKTGDYVQHFLTSMGCDSMVTLHLVVNNPVKKEISDTACGSYVWDNVVYINSGDYVQHYVTASGSDSTVTLHLVVNKMELTKLSDTTYLHADYQRNGFDIPADSLASLGLMYFQRVETSAAGCDSVIALSLTVVPEPAISIVEAAPTVASECSGDEGNIAYRLSGGHPVSYALTFGAEAKAQGFVDLQGAIPADSIISFKVPEGAKAGTYEVSLQFAGQAVKSEPFVLSFKVGFASDRIVRLWNDVVVCNNSDSLFKAYQWYHNDTLIAGATSQFYCDPNGISGNYSLQITTTDNQKLYH
jgi:nucleoside-specific outer membrane channel protein Tsx